uniref:Uncharacterized protein n=1 Tax=Prolemur simus TaxID=1328070 RepID=A0A8C9AIK7_PROSS
MVGSACFLQGKWLQIKSRHLNPPKGSAEGISQSVILFAKRLMSFLNCKARFPIPFSSNRELRRMAHVTGLGGTTGEVGTLRILEQNCPALQRGPWMSPEMT